MSWKRFGGEICCVLVLILFVGCNKEGSAGATSLSFNVEGTKYEQQNASLTVMKLNKNNLDFFDLGLDPSTTNIITAVPAARIQFKMEMNDIADLVGRPIELRREDYKHTGAIYQFRLTRDLTASSGREAALTLTLDHVDDGFVKGHFKGSNLSLVSMTENEFRKVDVTGEFRARLLR
jgi:hypothetical protein